MKMIMVKSVAFEAARGLMSRITDCHPYTSTDGLCDNSNFYMSVHKEATGYSVSCCKGGKIRHILKSQLTEHTARECLKKYIERMLIREMRK